VDGALLEVTVILAIIPKFELRSYGVTCNNP
jgi:hypothetical protein